MFVASLSPGTLPVARALPLAAALGLAVVLLAPSQATAAPAANFALRSDTLIASVTGTPRVGAWRVRIVAPGGNQRIDFVVRSADVAWSGVVRVSKRTDGRWSLVSKRLLTGNRRALESASSTAAGVRWSTAHFKLPRNGDSRFGVRVELTRSGAYRVVGAVRTAHEAFTLGPWTTVDEGVVSH